MAVNRTIYTQGAVIISGTATGVHFPGSLNSGFVLSGVQSANFTVSSPKLDVNAFGTLGPINKVQVEPQVATLEISFVVNSGNSGNGAGFLSGLAIDAQRPTPSGVTVTASGVGQVTSGVMSSFRMECAVGALPTITMTFEGISGAPVMNASAHTTINTTTVAVATPDAFGTTYWQGATTGCPQTVRVSWEMPVDRLNCLGSPINAPTVFSRPPGSMSFTAEGIDYTMIDSYLTGIQLGGYKVAHTAAAIKETSRSVNLAIGESAATFNVTSEGVALGATILGP